MKSEILLDKFLQRKHNQVCGSQSGMPSPLLLKFIKYYQHTNIMKSLFLLRCVLLPLGMAFPGWLAFANSDVPVESSAAVDGSPAVEDSQSVAFISLRKPTGSGEVDEFFGDERGKAYFGTCELSRFSFGSLATLKSYVENQYFYIPDSLIDISGIKAMNPGKVWRNLKKSSGQDRPVLYLHGYNMSFARSCKQAALFARNLDIGGRLLLFSWPSDGALLNYSRDEADLQWSVFPLEAILNEMQAQFGTGGFDVVAHSLGGRGVIYALQNIAHHNPGKQPILNQLILVAPDVDAGIFKQYLPSIRPLAANISLYVSDNDKPLALSQEVHGYPRLGETGTHLDDLKGVEVIDVSDIGRRSFSGHLYHLYHDRVIQDLKLLLNSGQTASQRSTLKKTGSRYWHLLPGEEE